jgi:hypothetical protein
VQPVLAQHHLQRRGHAGDVGADVDGVRDRDEHHHEVQHVRRVVAPHVARQAMARHPADACADFLHGHHQRQEEQRHPQHRRAEARPGLRIGRDAAGVVVGNASDEAGTDLTQRFNPLAFHP